MNKKVIFIDLDSTLIKTISGRPFAQYIADMTPIWKTWNYLKEWAKNIPDRGYILIVSNQGGIETGKGSDAFYMNSKFSFIRYALQEYIDPKSLKITVDFVYCPSEKKDNPNRKPGIGMFNTMVARHSLLGRYKKQDMIMIGDASGKPGDFSDSDLKAAENFGIDYLDVRDL